METRKDENGRLTVGEDELQRTRKECFKNLYNMDSKEQVAIDGSRRELFWKRVIRNG